MVAGGVADHVKAAVAGEVADPKPPLIVGYSCPGFRAKIKAGPGAFTNPQGVVAGGVADHVKAAVTGEVADPKIPLIVGHSCPMREAKNVGCHEQDSPSSLHHPKPHGIARADR